MAVQEAQIISATINVFKVGKLSVDLITVEAGKGLASSSPPKPLVVVSPLVAGTYPVVVFLHGYLLSNSNYTQVFKHIASHGFILVAPQLNALFPCSKADISGAAATTNWMANGHLSTVLPIGINPNLNHLALAGHSRGGHAAFSLALGQGPPTSLPFSALIGIDPVAGPNKSFQIPPKILTNEPNSFNLDIPTLVIGTGLGAEKKNLLFPPCAPDGVNHKEFYNECKPPSYYFVVSEFGHVDMLDDSAPKLYSCVCKDGKKDCRDLMRRSTGGIVVAFLKAYFDGDFGDLKGILKDPEIAPTKLDPVSYKEQK